MDFSELVTGLQHIGIPTGDIEQSIGFYKTIGFQEALLTAVPDTGGQVVFMKLDGLVLEIYESSSLAAQEGAINHFAMNVTDIEAAYRLVKENHLKILEPIQFLPFWENGVRFFIVEGPNRERVEFSQLLS